ncbi:MAG: hypothetical protein GY950_09055 [bacterium]|nr:hypothetical protein [bacterium]
MNKKLDDYLEEIDHYLVVEKGGKEILPEIKSHILDKAEQEYGKLSDEAIEKTIDGYGSPRQVAEKYNEGYEIISPSFKKYLFRYTAILFACHYGLTVLAFIFNGRLQAGPFQIPRIANIFELINQLPVVFLYDLGVVTLILYFVTQEKKDIKLPWPKFLKGEPKEVKIEPGKPKLVFLVLLSVAFCVVVFIYIRFGTLFFESLNNWKPVPALTSTGSTILSLLAIFAIGLETICYGIRFIKNSPWVNLVRDGIYLLVFWFLFNYPVENWVGEFPYFDLSLAAKVVFGIVAIFITYDFLKALIGIMRRHRRKGWEEKK